MKRKLSIVFVLGLLFFVVSCGEKRNDAINDFIEVRISRWTALDGGEIFLLRKIGTEWSGKLLGDGERFSCFYAHELKPKSDWNQFYNKLLVEGLNEMSGREFDMDINDGDGFNLEVTANGRLTRYSVANAEKHNSENAKRILKISEIINREFGTPVFVPHYDRGDVGEYLINNCRELRK